MRNDPGVAKVVYSGETFGGHGEARWEHFSEDCHTVWNVDDAFVLDNLGDEVTMREVITDWHANTQNHAAGVTFEHGLHVPLGLRVETLIKVWLIFLGETNARSKGVGIVVFKDAACGVHRAVNSTVIAQIRQVQCANDIGTNGLRLVILAPIDVRASGNTRRHEYVGGLLGVEFGGHVGAVFDTGGGKDDCDGGVFGGDEGGHFAADPAGFASVDKGFGEWGGCGAHGAFEGMGQC